MIGGLLVKKIDKNMKTCWNKVMRIKKMEFVIEFY
jgi:hypothetical protein